MKIFQKFIALIIIISLILSLNFELFLFKPKIAQAGADVIGGVSNVIKQIKDSILDPIGRFASKPAAKIITYELTRLLRGEFSDENKPLAILSWRKFLQEAVNRGSAKFIQDYKLTPLCAPIRVSLNTLLGLDMYGNLGTAIGYQGYAACTIGNIVDNVKEFWKNPSIGLYGWDTWTALAQPQNNIYGSFLLAAEEKTRQESEERESATLEGQAGQGFMNRSDCVKEATTAVPDYEAQDICDVELDQCGRTCEQDYADDPAYFEACQTECGDTYYTCSGEAVKEESSGVCLEYKVQNVGTELHRMIEKELDFDIDWLISADELEDLFSMLMTSILSSFTQGPGWGTAESSVPPQSLINKPYKQDMSYYQTKRMPPTAEEQTKSRTEILSLIFESIGKMSRKVATCKTERKVEQKGQMPEDQEREITRLENNLLELLEGFTMQLYLEETSIPLQPDFKVLDPANAPFKVYGQKWEDIDFNFYPPKCEKFGRECKEFDSKLPTWETHISQECKSCLSAVNRHIEECKKEAGYDEEKLKACTRDKGMTDAAVAGDCPSVAFADNCQNRLNLVWRTENTCEDCIQKAEDSCEGQKTEDEKTACIERFCRDDNLFANILDEFGIAIPDGQDFLNRCNIQEKKDTCYMCLKQYFMPASYAQEVRDYIGRAFIKHPYLLIETFHSRQDVGDKIEYYVKRYVGLLGGLNLVKDVLGWLFGGPDIEKYWEYHLNICVGTCPDIMHQEPKCKNDTRDQEVPLGLICRTFPDSPKCRSYCDPNTLTKDPIDFEPGDNDCQNETQKGAINPINLITNAAFRHRSKLCRALTGHVPEYYKKCTEPHSARMDCPEDCLGVCQEDFRMCREEGEKIFSLSECVEEKAACDDFCKKLPSCEEPEETAEWVCHSGTENLGVDPNEGEQHYSFASTNLNIDRKNTGVIYTSLDEGGYTNCVILRSLDPRPEIQKTTVYITKPYCDAYREVRGGKVYWSDINGDNQFSNGFVDVHASHPNELLGYCCASPGACPVGQEGGNFIPPPADKILCTFDIDDPNNPKDALTGEPYKVCCGLGGYTIERPTALDCANVGLSPETCIGKRYYKNGLYIVAVPDQPDSLGGADWCACENPSAGCGSTCSSASCP